MEDELRDNAVINLGVSLAAQIAGDRRLSPLCGFVEAQRRLRSALQDCMFDLAVDKSFVSRLDQQCEDVPDCLFHLFINFFLGS